MQKEPHRSGFPKSMQLLCRAFRINPKAQLLFTPLCHDRQQQRESAGCNQNGDMQCAFSCLWRSRNVLPLRQRNSFLDRCLCRNIVGSRCRRLRAVVCCITSTLSPSRIPALTMLSPFTLRMKDCSFGMYSDGIGK